MKCVMCDGRTGIAGGSCPRCLGSGIDPSPDVSRLASPPKEIRLTDPLTGGQKGSKLARYDLIPAEVLQELAEHYGRGALKYPERNWEKGYAWGLSFAALMRHAWAFWRGESEDPEGGSPLIAVAWHAFALRAFELRKIGTDNRSSK